MNRIHSTLPASEFTPPSSVRQIQLCKESHLPAIENGCHDTYTEYFAVGTEPEKDCPLHIPVPESEPIVIYPDILDQLLPETESEAPAVESEAPPIESEASPIESDQESSDSLNTETAPPDTEMPPYETESDTNSLQDLMNRLGA